MLVSKVDGSIYVGPTGSNESYVYKSSDGGASWVVSFQTTYGLRIWDIEEDPINGYLYFCTESPGHTVNASVMRSTDHGNSWENISPQPRSTFGHGLKIQVHPVTQHVYFLTESQRVLYKSTDFGNTWTGTKVEINFDLIIDKNYPSRFYGVALVTGTYVGGVYFSKDTGSSFTFGGLAGTSPYLAPNGTSTKLFAADYSGAIYVADLSAPSVTSTNPSANATNVPVNGLIAATFSEAMDATTINATTFTLSGGITGTVAYDSVTKRATFTPSHNLTAATTYTAAITAGVKDLAGNQMASEYTWSFTIAALPDLSGNWRSFVSLVSGRMIVGILRVSNTGSGSAGSFSVTFYLSNDGTKPGTVLQTNTVSRLRADSYVYIPFEHISWLRQSGTYLVAVIDPDNRVIETNEKNNVIRLQIQ